ncbi:MAG: alpha-N-arabinofuranosidase [Bacteroidales bacterium]|nr:alpha-N-arabinofuranosidase [Bacteroidales bacterium]
MRQKKILFLSVMMLLTAYAGAWAQKGNAIIKIDTDRTVGEINPHLYGNFSEHLGQGIYGGIYDPASSQSDEDGFRKDVIAATRELGVSVLRWPGGNFVSGYHWEDGIGDPAKRPTRIDLAWGGREPNLIGTDEFIRFARKAGVEPYFCVNLGTASLDEARNWVEYCNIEKDTYYSDLRRANGSEKPHKVIYWGLGNEVDGPWQMGHKTPDEYAKVAIETAKLMRWIDSDIKLIASGSSNYDADWNLWNRTVLDQMYDYIDYISLHHYSHNNADYYTYLTNTLEVEKYIRIVEQQIQEAKMKNKSSKDVYIAFDEWNAWTRTFGGKDNTLSEIYDLQDALVVAQYLNIFMRTCQVVKMANMAQLVNVIAPMRTQGDVLWKQTTWYPLYLFSKNCRGTALDVFTRCDSFKTSQYGSVPYLDVSATYEPERGEIVVNVVNRHKDNSITAEILSQNVSFGKTAIAHIVTGSDVTICNSAEEQNVKVKDSSVKTSPEKITYTFEPHSFTQIIVKCR